jgi:hypothetical protein
MSRCELSLFADYFQFYLQDEEATGDLSESWTEAATEDLLALAPGTIGVGTVRNIDVPVVVEVGSAPPPDAFDAWDQVVECSIEVPSGLLVIAGCTDYLPDAKRIEMAPGSYRARIFYGGLDTVGADGVEGEDCYRVCLWPHPVGAPVVLKRRGARTAPSGASLP